MFPVNNRYVYGVVEGDPIEFETDAVGGASVVYTISHRRLGAVVSDIDTTDPERPTRTLHATTRCFDGS